MTEQQTQDRIDSRELQQQAAEHRRFRAFTSPNAWGGAGLSEEEATELIAALETQPTE